MRTYFDGICVKLDIFYGYFIAICKLFEQYESNKWKLCIANKLNKNIQEKISAFMTILPLMLFGWCIMALKMLYRGPSSRLETLIEKIQQNKDSTSGRICVLLLANRNKFDLIYYFNNNVGNWSPLYTGRHHVCLYL